MWAPLSEEALDILGKGVFECLSRWTALQLVIENGWDEKSSKQKSHELYGEIMSFFTCSKEQRYIDEMEDLLEESMDTLFGCDIEDGSIYEVAELLFIVHEECVNGNFDAVRQRFSQPAAAGSRKSEKLPEPQDQNSAEGNYDGFSDDSGDEMEMDDNRENTSGAILAKTSTVDTKVVRSNLTQEEIADGWQDAPTRNTRRRSAAKS